MTKTYGPRKLPFLQSQTLEKIYLDIYNDKKTTIEELSEITAYPTDSKILLNAIDSLVKKSFILKNNSGYSVPQEREDFFEEVIKKTDIKNKSYSRSILESSNYETQSVLFSTNECISDLNQHGVIHKWYNYLEEFPYSLIEKKIKEYNLQEKDLVLDPFCGSGTTLISANFFHCDGIGFDMNPLMKLVSKVKTTWDINLSELRQSIENVANSFLNQIQNVDNINFKNDFIEIMPKKELNQWLSPVLQKEVSLLKDIINEVENQDIRDLMSIAMSKSCFDASYVSLCPGTTFYPFRKKEEFWDIFTKRIITMYKDLKVVQQHDSYGKSQIINDTCLDVQDYIENDSISFVITSPPYPNDLEYTRQTRLELYLLDFVKNMNDVQQIKRKMVKGSTKLIFKESNSELEINQYDYIMDISAKIYEQTKDKNWGFDYPRMVKEYFGDMYLCMEKIYPTMKEGSHFLLVVGDQTIKGVLIPVGDILIKLAEDIGYIDCKKEVFRMRRSTGHQIPLPEEIVILKK